MKIIARIVLLVLNAIISAFNVGYGLSGPGFIADGAPKRVPWALFIGLVLPLLLIVLLFFGRSNKRAEKLFWYLGIGFPLIIFLFLFVG